MLCVFTALLLIADLVSAHGRLRTPPPRGFTLGYENDPVPSNVDPTFVCRNPKTETTPVTYIHAGTELEVMWDMTAPHYGDCAFYISYDTAKAEAEQKYFKIANWKECQDVNNQVVTIYLPDWLPRGQAILRWDWIALHASLPEYFVQCADVEITPTSQELSLDSIITYSIIQPALYPADFDEGVGFRNPHDAGEQYVTGPACAIEQVKNECGSTAEGTTGNIEVPITITTPSPTTPGDTSAPTYEPTNKAECEIYIVTQGDTLNDIAIAYTQQGMPVTADEICEFNRLPDCDDIWPGSDLSIPCATCGCGQCCACTEEEEEVSMLSSSSVPDSVVGFLISIGVLCIILLGAILFILCAKCNGYQLVLSKSSVDDAEDAQM